MKRVFKKYFIPHEENDHRPHFLRTQSTIIIGLAIGIFEIALLTQFLFFGPQTGLLALIFPDVLVDYTNQERAEYNTAPLSTNEKLEQAAILKAQDMAKKGYFAHTSPEGLSPWYWFVQAGYNFTYAGENLAVNFSDSQDVIDAWMNSPGHRENILNGKFTEIGIATAQGTYKGMDAVFVVQMFGKPLPLTAQESSSKPQPQIQPSQEQVVVAPTRTQEEPTPQLEQEMFVAVENSSADIEETEEVASPSVLPSQSNFVEKFATTPKNTAQTIYLFVGLLVLFALALKIFIKIKIQHPQLIANGVFLLLMIGGALILNQFVALRGADIF